MLSTCTYSLEPDDENSRQALDRISQRSAARSHRMDATPFEGANGTLVHGRQGPGVLHVGPSAVAAPHSNVGPIAVYVDDENDAAAATRSHPALATPAAPWQRLPTVAQAVKENAGAVTGGARVLVMHSWCH